MASFLHSINIWQVPTIFQALFWTLEAGKEEEEERRGETMFHDLMEFTWERELNEVGGGRGRGRRRRGRQRRRSELQAGNEPGWCRLYHALMEFGSGGNVAFWQDYSWAGSKAGAKPWDPSAWRLRSPARPEGPEQKDEVKMGDEVRSTWHPAHEGDVRTLTLTLR